MLLSPGRIVKYVSQGFGPLKKLYKGAKIAENNKVFLWSQINLVNALEAFF